MKKIFLGFSLILISQACLHAMDLEKLQHTARIKSLKKESKNINLNIRGLETLMVLGLTPLTLSIIARPVIYLTTGILPTETIIPESICTLACISLYVLQSHEYKKLHQIKSQISLLKMATKFDTSHNNNNPT